MSIMCLCGAVRNVPSVFQYECLFNIFEHCPDAKVIASDSVGKLQNKKSCFVLL